MIRVIGIARVVSVTTFVDSVTAAVCLAATLAIDFCGKRAVARSWRCIFGCFNRFESEWLFTACHKSKEAY